MRPFLFFLLTTSFYFISLTSHETPFFQRIHQPYHISIGAVLFNSNGQIAVLHRESNNSYTLMRESVENDESLFATLHRGLQEEMGATAHPIAFLGTLTGIIHSENPSFEKTTLYIACQLIDQDLSKRNLDDYEMDSKIEWLTPQELISIMVRQGKSFKQIDRDESKIIKRALPYIYQTLEKTSSNQKFSDYVQ